MQGGQRIITDETASKLSISHGKKHCKNGLNPTENISFISGSGNLLDQWSKCNSVKT
jgi:hypothetical protein